MSYEFYPNSKLKTQNSKLPKGGDLPWTAMILLILEPYATTDLLECKENNNVSRCTRPAGLCRARARSPAPLGRDAGVRAAARADVRRPEVVVPRRADHRQQPDGRPPRLG